MYQLPFIITSPAISLSATASALAAVALPTTGNAIRIVNEGPNIVFVSIGSSSVLATVPSASATQTSTPILVGVDTIFSRQIDRDLFISTICRSAGTATLTVQCGEGLR